MTNRGVCRQCVIGWSEDRTDPLKRWSSDVSHMGNRHCRLHHRFMVDAERTFISTSDSFFSHWSIFLIGSLALGEECLSSLLIDT